MAGSGLGEAVTALPQGALYLLPRKNTLLVEDGHSPREKTEDPSSSFPLVCRMSIHTCNPDH